MQCIRNEACFCGGSIVARKEELVLSDPPETPFVCEFCTTDYGIIPVCNGTVRRVLSEDQQSVIHCACDTCGAQYPIGAVTESEQVFAQARA
jgi:hypothetical protein